MSIPHKELESRVRLGEFEKYNLKVDRDTRTGILHLVWDEFMTHSTYRVACNRVNLVKQIRRDELCPFCADIVISWLEEHADRPIGRPTV